MVTLNEIIWAQSLSQNAKLIALNQALREKNSHSVSICTDLQYLSHCTHPWCFIPGTGSVDLHRKGDKNKKKILALITTLWLSTNLANIHCPGHQKKDSVEAWGNSQTSSHWVSEATANIKSALNSHLSTWARPVRAMYVHEWRRKFSQTAVHKGRGLVGSSRQTPHLIKVLGTSLLYDIHQSTHLELIKLK